MDLLVDRTDLRRTRLEDTPPAELAPGQARLTIERFALTANNVTYAAIGDLLEDPLSADAYENVIDAVAGEQLRALLSRLTDREHDVVRARFGFDTEPQKLVEIGEELGISAERVRQIEERALAKLRQTA